LLRFVHVNTQKKITQMGNYDAIWRETKYTKYTTYTR